jgi:hypothetical protein
LLKILFIYCAVKPRPSGRGGVQGRTIPEVVIHDLKNIDHELRDLQIKKQSMPQIFQYTSQGWVNLWMSHHLQSTLDIFNPSWKICCKLHNPISDEKYNELIQIQRKLRKYHNMIMENSEDEQTLFILEIMNDFENWLISMQKILLRKQKSYQFWGILQIFSH